MEEQNSFKAPHRFQIMNYIVRVTLRAMLVAAFMVIQPRELPSQIVNGVVLGLTNEPFLLARRGPPDNSGRNAVGLIWHQWGEWVVYFEPTNAKVARVLRYMPMRSVLLARARQTYGTPVRSRLDASMRRIVDFAGDTILAVLSDDSRTIQYIEFSRNLDLLPVIGEQGVSWTQAFYQRLAITCRSAPQPRDRVAFRGFVKSTAQAIDSEFGVTLDSTAAYRREVFVAINFLRMEGSSVPQFCVKASRTRDRIAESLRLTN